MKVSTLIALIVLLAGCGKEAGNMAKPINPKAPGPCYDATNGNWQSIGTAAYKLALTDQCEGASTYCNEVFTIHPQANGTTILLVTGTNGGPECLPMGATTCTASVIPGQNNNQIQVNCGGGRQISNNFNRI